MRPFIRLASVVATAMLTVAAATAQNAPEYHIHKYNTNDGGILTGITANGQWAIIQLGTSQGGGNATPKLYNVDTEEVIPVTYGGRTFDISDVSDDGNIVVGSISGRPASYNRATNQIKVYPMRPLWQTGYLSSVTPDGKYAVGAYNGFNGKLDSNDELSHDYYYSTLYVDLEKGDTVGTPGIPKRDMAHLDQHAIKFNDISPDGRFILGEMSWYIMQPNSPVTFLYDTQENNYRIVGFTEHDRTDWTPLAQYLHHLESPVFSPDGRWVAGMAYMAEPQDGSEFFREYGAPFRYDVQEDKFEVLSEAEANVDGCVIDNQGTIFGNPSTGGPLRDFRILYQDKYWITFSQICKQQYGFNFSEKTGYDRTGTVVGVSGDGSRFVSFPDPLGESYCFDFGRPVEEVCDGIDLLDNYSVNPVAGSVFSQLASIEINFGRAVQVLGTGRNVHLYREDGTKVADGLSAGNQGLQLKVGSKTTVNAVFRTRLLEAGVKYYVSIDAGAIAVAGDANRANKEIRIPYTGRTNGPVEYVKATPEDHSQLRQIDASSSYILVTFDSPVHLTDNAAARLIRVEDGSLMATLTMNEGNTENTKNQVLLYPTSTVYLYDGLEYKVVIDSASVCDYSGSAVSYNHPIELTYHGTYVREVSNESVLFADDFSDPSASYANWLRFEGDHRTPLASMQNMGFTDADNFPWQFGLADDNTYSDMFAASHSMYAPSGQSDDWMMTPQMLMPEDGKATLEFDAQSYLASKEDVLKVYVFEEDFEIAFLNEAWMEDVRQRAVLLDSITLSAGDRQEQTAGEWTRYHYDLSPWAGKNIYIAFVNQNTNQSVIFVDNVAIQRELLFAFGFSNADRVVNRQDITIAGQFTVKSTESVKGITLTLKDAQGQEVSRVEWPNISGDIKDRPIPFSFEQPLPLQLGEENPFSIEVQLGERTEVYQGTIADLTFEPTKRVVLEEMTGIDCPNCPLGILSIEKCEKAFGERFIPISIHTFTGDPYASGLEPYSSFLGLNAAPSGRINRIPGTFYPMVSAGGQYYDTYPDVPVWYDIVAQELSKLTVADLDLKAELSEDGKQVQYTTDLRYALNSQNQQLSLLVVLLENGIIYAQANNLGSLDFDILGEWGAGGMNSGAYAYPVTHNDVARAVVGQTFSGTIGLFPTELQAGQTYTSTFSSMWPSSIEDAAKAHAVAMLIDTQSGEVINAARAQVQKPAEDAISPVLGADQKADVFTLSGLRVMQGATRGQLQQLPAGIYIVNGRKMMVK